MKWVSTGKNSASRTIDLRHIRGASLIIGRVRHWGNGGMWEVLRGRDLVDDGTYVGSVKAGMDAADRVMISEERRYLRQILGRS